MPVGRRKLTADQFSRLIGKLPEIRSGYSELQKELRGASTKKVREVLAEGIWWAAFYEQPFVQHIALALIAIGFADKFVALTKAEDPQQALLDFVEAADDFEPVGADGKELDLGHVLAAVTSMQRTILSIMLYQKSLSALIAEAREGDDDSLFKAVRVDRSAMTCPSIAVRISKAQVLDDRRFFEKLRSALKGPSRKHWEIYGDLRYSLAVLRELGFDAMSDAQLEHLLVDVLKVYPASFTARKNLRQQYYLSRKIRST